MSVTTFGIDKVRVRTQDFLVRELNPAKGWRGVPQTIDGTEHLPWMHTTQGQEVTERKWVWNGDGTHEAPIYLTLSNGGLDIHWNPSTLEHPYELNPSAKTSLESVKRCLDGLGVQWPEDSTPIHEVHLTKQRAMEHPCHVYLESLGLLQPSRMDPRKRKEYGRNAVSFENSQFEAIAYDKTTQLLETKDVVSAPNLFRLEAKWKNKRSVQGKATGLHVNTLGELVTTSTAQLERDFRLSMGKRIFRTEGEQLSFDFVEVATHFEYFVRTYSNAPHKAFLRHHGMSAFLEAMNYDLSNFELVLDATRIPKATKYRWLKEVRSMEEEHGRVNRSLGMDGPSTYLQDLREAFLTPLL